MNIFHAIKDEIEAPINLPVSAKHLALMTGIVMVSIILWTRILIHLRLE